MERQAEYEAKLEAAQAKYPDFVEVMSNPSVLFSPGFVDAAGETGVEADIFYWLAKHPDESKRVLGETFYDEKAPGHVVLAKTRAAVREVAKIQAAIEAEGKAQPPKAETPKAEAKPKAEEPPKAAAAPAPTPTPKVSAAPAPIKPVGSTPSGATEAPMNPTEYVAWRKAHPSKRK